MSSDNKPIFSAEKPYEGAPLTAGARLRLNMGNTKSRAARLLEPAQIANPGGAANGFVEGRGYTVPYKIDQDKIDGGIVHLWLADRDTTPDMLRDLCQVALRHLTVVSFTYSDGTPESFDGKKLLRRR